MDRFTSRSDSESTSSGPGETGEGGICSSEASTWCPAACLNGVWYCAVDTAAAATAVAAASAAADPASPAALSAFFKREHGGWRCI